MKRQKNLFSFFAGACLLILILDSRTALSGAAEGISLCIKTVVPSLFPFLFFSALLVNSLWGEQRPFLRLAGSILGIPPGADSLLITALLGGYPAGAQVIGESFRNNRLSADDASRLLHFCSNTGPAFLFGFLSASFPDPGMLWAPWFIQLLSAVITAILGSSCSSDTVSLPDKSLSVTQVMIQTVKTMALICGWILLFQILSAFLTRWFLWRFPAVIQILISGLLELSTGCVLLARINSFSMRFLLCSAFLSFGGVCVLMQTASVISPLSVKPYLLGKLQQTLISFILSAVYLQSGWTAFLPITLFWVSFPVIFKKRGRFPSVSGV